MTDLDDRVLDAATDQGTLRADEFVRLCERYADDGPGVTQETLTAYARALADADEEVALETHIDELNDQGTHAISDGLLVRELRGRRTDATDWEGEEVYVLDADEDRLSAYPRSWHEAIGGETDLEEILRFLGEREAFRQDAGAGTGKIRAEHAISVASAVGGLTPAEAREGLRELETDGEVIEASEAPGYHGLESRGADESGASLPPALDFRNALDEIETRADADVGDDTEAIRSQLERFAERDDSGRESLLSDIDRLTVDLEARTSGNAARRAEGIRNQIEAYRESLETDAGELSLSGARLVDENGDDVDLEATEGTLATLQGTLVNGGNERGVVAMCTLYDESGTAIRTIESGVYDLDEGAQRSVAIDLYVPENATGYAAAALDAAGPRATGDAKPDL